MVVTLHRKALLEIMENKEALDTLNEIKDLMAKSSKFGSVSGGSVLIIGLLASIVAAGAWLLLLPHIGAAWLPERYSGMLINSPQRTLIASAVAVGLLAVSMAVVSFGTYRKIVRRQGRFVFDQTVRRPLAHFCVPMAAGGALCLALLLQGHYGLTSSMMLVFYGLSLLNSSHYTLKPIAWLGYAELALGIADCYIVTHAILFWWLGFGLMHILLGVYILIKGNRC